MTEPERPRVNTKSGKLGEMPTAVVRVAACGLFVSLPIAAAAWWPCRQWGGQAGVQAMLMAAGLCTTAVVLSLVPMTVAAVHQAGWIGMACLVGPAIRLMLTLLGAVLIYHWRRPPLGVFAVCLMVFYLALLVWETLASRAAIRAAFPIEPRHTCSTEQPNP